MTTKTEQNNGIAMFNTGNEGSVLGPLLFIMYINDIAEKLISPTRLFADYTYFSYSNRDELQIKTVIDHDLEELDEWPKKWLMTFNRNYAIFKYGYSRIQFYT